MSTTMTTTKVPKKIKTLSKRGGRNKRREFVEDEAPQARLTMNDVVHAMDLKHIDDKEKEREDWLDWEDWIDYMIEQEDYHMRTQQQQSYSDYSDDEEDIRQQRRRSTRRHTSSTPTTPPHTHTNECYKIVLDCPYVNVKAPRPPMSPVSPVARLLDFGYY
jgi:hypothetical protein